MEVVPVVPSEGDGNTESSPRSCCYLWCFTLNNPSVEEIESVKSLCSNCAKVLVFQMEVGEEGTPHLQGYISMITKKRLTSMKGLIPRAHFEKCRNKKASIAYCMKEEGRLSEPFIYGMKFPEKLRNPLDGKVLKDFQEFILGEISTVPNDRNIFWFWEDIGGVGKTSLCKHICMTNDDALILNGKQNDMFHAIMKYSEDNDGCMPKIIIIDIPRCMLDYVSWGAIEKIKDGLFYSGKYEGGMVVMNCPHVICFANAEPDRSRMSEDRWRVISIVD